MKKLKDLLKESFVWERQFGEKLPTLTDVQKKHQNNDFSDLICKNCDQTVKDDTVLIYKCNPARKVGMDNTTLYSWK